MNRLALIALAMFAAGATSANAQGLLGTIINAAKQAQQRQQAQPQQQTTSQPQDPQAQQTQTNASPPTTSQQLPDIQNVPIRQLTTQQMLPYMQEWMTPEQLQDWERTYLSIQQSEFVDYYRTCNSPAMKHEPKCDPNWQQDQQKANADFQLNRAKAYFAKTKDKWVVEKISYDDKGRMLLNVDEPADIPIAAKYGDIDFFTGEQCSAMASEYINYEVKDYLSRGVVFRRIGDGVYKLVGSATARYINNNPMISAADEMKVDDPSKRLFRGYDFFICVQHKHTDTNEYKAYVSALMTDDRANSMKEFPDLKEERDH